MRLHRVASSALGKVCGEHVANISRAFLGISTAFIILRQSHIRYKHGKRRFNKHIKTKAGLSTEKVLLMSFFLIFSVNKSILLRKRITIELANAGALTTYQTWDKSEESDKKKREGRRRKKEKITDSQISRDSSNFVFLASAIIGTS